MLDENTDKLQRNTNMAKRKEEATISAREEIKAQTLREMQLKSEVLILKQTFPDYLYMWQFHPIG